MRGILGGEDPDTMRRRACAAWRRNGRFRVAVAALRLLSNLARPGRRDGVHLRRGTTSVAAEPACRARRAAKPAGATLGASAPRSVWLCDSAHCAQSLQCAFSRWRGAWWERAPRAGAADLPACADDRVAREQCLCIKDLARVPAGCPQPCQQKLGITRPQTAGARRGWSTISAC